MAATVSRSGGQGADDHACVDLLRMSLLGRLFGSKPPPPPPNSVLIDEDLVDAIAPSGTSLQAAVNQTLRDHLAAEAKAADEARRKQEAEQIPFWLRRDAEQSQIEDELRDRVIQRQTASDDGDVDAAGRRAGAKQVESAKQIEIGGS